MNCNIFYFQTLKGKSFEFLQTVFCFSLQTHWISEGAGERSYVVTKDEVLKIPNVLSEFCWDWTLFKKPLGFL